MQFDIAGFLPAVFADVLGEVALRVHEANCDERQAEVGGFLKVITGEDAQAAGIDRQGFVQAVFH